MPPDRQRPDRGPRISSWQRAKVTPVVCRSFEHHAGYRTIYLDFTSLLRRTPWGVIRGLPPSSPSTNITRGLAARRLFKVPHAAKALYIYKHPCLVRDSNPVPAAPQSASPTTIPVGRQTAVFSSDLELEVNEVDIEKLIMGHEDELTIEELQEILNKEHQDPQQNVSPYEQEEDEKEDQC
ncbi:hypothetical protein TNCV_2705971 [Trichonephila clavipes]|nr:hypothetical protein TNCV_2705971 [Trichonephila clavipes]